jgi:probable rRNA maturation factor
MKNLAIYLQVRTGYKRRGLNQFVRNTILAAINEGNPLLAKDKTKREMSVVLSDDAHLHELNLAFRGQDKATDVLSFAGHAIGDKYLGDIVISMEHCVEQAERAQHSLDDELALLIIHGTLHLIGYDHDTSANRETMWRVQRAALERALQKKLSDRLFDPQD